MDRLLFILTLAAALGSGLVAGIFYAFSTFVMGALGRLPPPQGIAAMQSINIVVINPWFFAAFFGTAALCLLLAVWALASWQQPGSALLLIGSALYIVGTIVVTMMLNVPLNNQLAAVDPASAEGARLWAHYLDRWTFWNTIRTIAPFVAAALLTLALYLRRTV